MIDDDGSFDHLLAGIGIGVTAGATPPGWFGKLACLGDFAHRRLPAPFVEALDAWLSDGMAASRSQLGDAWLDTYLTGPVWRFAFAPGVVDSQWWFGVLMPSVDTVGRYFPLVVARGDAWAPETVDGIAGLDTWYRHVGAAVLDTLRPLASVETFESVLSGAPAWPPTVPLRRPELTRLPGRDRYVLDGEVGLAQWVSGVGLLEALQLCAGKSLWWPDHATTPDTSLSLTHGLPRPEHFASLLEGRW